MAVVGMTGELLATSVIYPHPPQNEKGKAAAKIEELVRKHQCTVVAIGNGTACRETEQLVASVIASIDSVR